MTGRTRERDRFYAGETIKLFALLQDDDELPVIDQPDGNLPNPVTMEIVSLDGLTTHLAETGTSLLARDQGTATAGSSDSLTDDDQDWEPGQWQGFVVKITAGTGSGQARRVRGNTTTKLTVTEDWATAPDGTSQYDIHESRYEVNWDSPASLKDTEVVQVVRIYTDSPAATSINKAKLFLRGNPP